MLLEEMGAELVKRFGSPLYVYDLDEVAARAKALRRLLPKGARLLFSLKANPLPALGEVLCAAGCDAEVSSAGELTAALEAGFRPGGILYTGPGKGVEELRAAVAAGVGCFSCESFAELDRLVEVAAIAGERPRVLLRLNPPQAPSAGLVMSGGPSQFGFEESDLLAGAERVRAAAAWLDVLGAHVYFGTQVAGASSVLANTRNAIAAAQRSCRALGLPCRVIDAGGGFPWPFAVPGAGPDLSPLRQGLLDLWPSPETEKGAQLWFESGRYLCAAAGSLQARIVDVKRSQQGKRYVILDSGINHLAGMSGVGRILRPRIGVRLVGKPSNPESDLYHVVGPLCSPLDTLCCDLALEDPRPGDLVEVANVGAYGLTASLVSFLSREPPLEIICRGGEFVGAYRLRHGHEQQLLPSREARWTAATKTA